MTTSITEQIERNSLRILKGMGLDTVAVEEASRTRIVLAAFNCPYGQLVKKLTKEYGEPFFVSDETGVRKKRHVWQTHGGLVVATGIGRYVTVQFSSNTPIVVK